MKNTPLLNVIWIKKYKLYVRFHSNTPKRLFCYVLELGNIVHLLTATEGSRRSFSQEKSFLTKQKLSISRHIVSCYPGGCCCCGAVHHSLLPVPAVPDVEWPRLHPPHRRLLLPLQRCQVLRDRDRLPGLRGVDA